jgi:hypothetical protein
MKKRYTEEQIIGFLKKPTPISGGVTGVARLLVGCGVAFPSATNGSAEFTLPLVGNPLGGQFKPVTQFA